MGLLNLKHSVVTESMRIMMKRLCWRDGMEKKVENGTSGYVQVLLELKRSRGNDLTSCERGKQIKID